MRHRSHLPLAPQVEKSSLPRPQDVSTVSISTTSPVLSILPQAFSLVPYRTFSVICINIFADLDPVLVDIPIVRTDISTLFAAIARVARLCIPLTLRQQHRP